MGAEPRWLLVTSLLPEGRTTEAMVEEQFRSLQHACSSLGIVLVGGHTEITVGLDRPILVGLMIGETAPDQLLDLRRCRPGDSILLFNRIAVEGTAILANEAARVGFEALAPPLLERARGFTQVPGISVVPAARALLRSGATVRGMHDPTEGGVATALHELARVSRLQVQLGGDEIPIHYETTEICAAFGLDPMGLIASGALLAVVAGNEEIREIIALIRNDGIEVAVIGRLIESGAGEPRVLDVLGLPLREFATDEIARFFARSEPGDSS
jgi:hydrogenase maturation factor